MDIVPLNADVTECRPNRQPSAFDLEKCFESIPITNTEHSLISRISCFLDLVWKEKHYVSSEKHPWKPGPKQECFWSDDTGEFSYIKERVLELCLEVTKHAIVTVGNCSSLQAVGIPMGFSVSVIFLNIYMFTYEYEFTQRMIIAAPHMIEHTKEFYRYVDDLGNFSDLDLRPFLTKLDTKPTSWDWIYPMAPWEPLSMTDQTDRSDLCKKVIYLNLEFTLTHGYLSYQWHDKIKVYKALSLPTCSYTHWSSALSYASKMGTVKSQVRAVIIASSSLAQCRTSLSNLLDKFVNIGYPCR